jgi:hypothetical protein
MTFSVAFFIFFSYPPSISFRGPQVQVALLRLGAIEAALSGAEAQQHYQEQQQQNGVAAAGRAEDTGGGKETSDADMVAGEENRVEDNEREQAIDGGELEPMAIG